MSPHPPSPHQVSRWRLDLAYDGTDFSGWATQPHLRTVQGELEPWIAQVLRLPTPAQLVVAGRTDAGVHATGQVAHLDLPLGPLVTERDGQRPLPEVLTSRLRRVLPPDIDLSQVRPAPAGFDARFSAVWRRYVYRLWDDQTTRIPTLRRRATTVRGRVDLALAEKATSSLLGLRDFAAFCKPREGATSIRDLYEFSAARNHLGELELTLVADAFCHSMVRSLVGAVLAVAQHRRPIDWLARVADSPGRHPEVVVMPASGLTLEEVGYPPEAELASRAEQTRARRRTDGAPR